MPKLDDVLQEIGFGPVRVKVQNGKIVVVPGDQKIERPSKIDGIVIQASFYRGYSHFVNLGYNKD